MKWLLKPWFVGKLIVVFLYDLVVSTMQVAAAVLSIGPTPRPRLMTVPLDTETDVQTTLVGNMISLTPGTLTVDVGPGGRTLLVHDMFGGDSSESARAAIKDGLEKRVMEATR